ncbi:acyl-coenzyme A thioesterase THEM4 isoform X2 [Lagopus leucura]|nr:acyl-coenzyme A thioesterase THEM4 isoform X2 [Lagopus leucura]
MREQFQHLLRRAADGSWRRIPSYRRGLDHLPEVLQMVVGPVTGPGPRLFLRNLDAEGAGFEYAIFLHASGHRTQCLCQLGPYLEGHHGFAHGGAIATLIDTTVGTCALAVAKTSVMTAKLSISYLAPTRLSPPCPSAPCQWVLWWWPTAAWSGTRDARSSFPAMCVTPKGTRCTPRPLRSSSRWRTPSPPWPPVPSSDAVTLEGGWQRGVSVSPSGIRAWHCSGIGVL